MAGPMIAVGQSKESLDTPALVVDLDIMEANIARIAKTCREHGVGWRPHTKGQKTLEIVRKEIAAGAIGVTCAKLGESEVMADAGITNILIANQIVGPIKIARLMALIDRADPIVSVDSMANLAELADATSRANRKLRVVIEVDIGMKRAGVEPGAAVVALADAIAQHVGLIFTGLMAWESHAVTIADPAEKARVVAAAINLLTSSAAACRKRGHSVEIVSCGGSGTFPYCAQQPGVTEVQIGGAVFSGVYYRTQQHIDFPCALTILACVTSRPTPTRIVIDAGMKAISTDVAQPSPIGLPDVRSLRLSAEHATIELQRPSETPRIGDRVELIVGYPDTTVNLYDEIVGVRRGRVEAVWQIAGRGKIR
jgi:D-serine deaminase-like pyridoxal phosphate-dependent protein